MNTEQPATDVALSRLLQLASPLLPVGAYSYSQGLEWAIEAGTVHDAASAQLWIGDALEFYLFRFEIPLLLRMYHCWQNDDEVGLMHWHQWFCSGRDNAEARAETLQMGYSLARLLNEFDDIPEAFRERLKRFAPLCFPLVYAGASALWQIQASACAHAYAWSWLENQVSAALKAVPLGQVAGQKMLLTLSARLPEAVRDAGSLPDEALCNFAPGLTLAGCRHETQYSRLFRS